ncbi:hypothetical protein AYK86_03525 [Acinetobacter venetianus]|uniref:hypothetical protein n=1 Tax=Acinetobacter venetianus TaxID=52133 RepID=UPI000775BBC1|nr:hypothetical protein [Acinetobacter venetianus]KXO86102.1 hypothetical protein AYK86_03525 [Acinetobacter venetianus]
MKEDIITYLGVAGVTITVFTGWYKEVASSGFFQHLFSLFSLRRLRIRHKIQDIDMICTESSHSEEVKNNLRYEQRLLYLEYYYGLNIEDNDFYEYMTGYKNKRIAFSFYKNGGRFLEYKKDLQKLDFIDPKQKKKVNLYKNLGLIIYILISAFAMLCMFKGIDLIGIYISDKKSLTYLGWLLGVNVVLPVFIVIIGAWILNKFFRRFHAQRLTELERIPKATKPERIELDVDKVA